MAIALVGHTAAGSADGNAVTTPNIDSTGANFLAQFVAFDGATSPTPTDNKGNTWTGLTTFVGNFARGRWWYSIPTSVGGGHNAGVNVASSFPTTCFLAFSGVAASPFDVQNGATGLAVSALATGSITPGQINELILVGLMVEAAISALSIDGTGFTITDQVAQVASQHYGANVAYKVKTDAVAENRTWSWTTAVDCCAAIASFKAAASFVAKQRRSDGIRVGSRSLVL